MANVVVFTGGYVSINGTEYSTQVRQVTLTYSAEALDKTAMTDVTRARTGGLKDHTLDLDVFQDANSLDAELFALVGSSTFTWIVRATTAAASTSNPQYSATGFLNSYNPLSGSVGELLTTPVRIMAAGDISRATA